MSVSSKPGRERLAFALDVPSLAKARPLIDQLKGEVGVFKVGLELFTAAGPEAVRVVHDAGSACFLDLKLHDIPATVGRAVAAAAAMGVEYLTVHAACGPEALMAAQQAAAASKTRLLAITVLTSLSDADLLAIGMDGVASTAAERLAHLAQTHGVNGFVCSAREAAALRRTLGPTAFLVTPGIREPGTDVGDQERVEGPADAIAAGSNLLVVGRPIRDAKDPLAAAVRFRTAIAGAQAS